VSDDEVKITLCTFIARHATCNVWEVGFFDLRGQWVPVASCAGKERAFYRVHLLHGGGLSFLDFMRWWANGEE